MDLYLCLILEHRDNPSLSGNYRDDPSLSGNFGVCLIHEYLQYPVCCNSIWGCKT